MNITDIQIFPVCAETFSANIAVNDSWMIQLGTDGAFSIPDSNEAVWNDERAQDLAADELSADAVAEFLSVPTDIEGLLELGAEVFDASSQFLNAGIWRA